MPNYVVLSGRLAFDPKPNPGQSGKGPTSIRINAPRREKGQNGEMEWHNQYFTALVFGNERESLNAMKQGETVFLTGRLRWREYTPENGPKKEYVEILADSISTTLPEPNKQEELPQEEGSDW